MTYSVQNGSQIAVNFQPICVYDRAFYAIISCIVRVLNHSVPTNVPNENHYRNTSVLLHESVKHFLVLKVIINYRA